MSSDALLTDDQEVLLGRELEVLRHLADVPDSVEPGHVHEFLSEKVRA